MMLDLLLEGTKKPYMYKLNTQEPVAVADFYFAQKEKPKPSVENTNINHQNRQASIQIPFIRPCLS
jgi:hypothetical protein